MTVQRAIRFDDELLKRVELAAAEDRRTFSGMVQRLIEQALDRRDIQIRAAAELLISEPELDLDALAGEAERGYDVDKIQPTGRVNPVTGRPLGPTPKDGTR